MKLPIFLFAAALTSFAVAQKPSDWRPTTVTPQAFAKKIDAALFNLKNAYGQGEFYAEVPWGGGGKGVATLEIKIRDRKTFHIDTIKILPNVNKSFNAQTLFSLRGKMLIWEVDGGKITRLTAGKDPGFGARQGMLLGWRNGFQRLMFQSYFTGQGAFQALITELLQPGSGYTVQLQERTIQGKNMKIPQIRIYAKRTAAFEKKYGGNTIEIVADSRLWLPLQISSTESWKKQKALYQWSMAWSGPKIFKDAEFEIAKK